MGIKYGQQTIEPFTAATAFSTTWRAVFGTVVYWGSSVTNPTPQGKVFISNKASSPVNIYIRWNASNTVDITNNSRWDHCLLPGDELCSPDGMQIKSIRVKCVGSGDPTYGTDFIVKGIE